MALSVPDNVFLSILSVRVGVFQLEKERSSAKAASMTISVSLMFGVIEVVGADVPAVVVTLGCT